MFKVLSILHTAGRVFETSYGRVFENPSPDQMKSLQHELKKYIDSNLEENPKWTEDMAEDMCCLRLLQDGKDIFVWACPPVFATHYMMMKELGLKCDQLENSSGLRYSDFAKYGYNIRTIFDNTVKDWVG
jgi:hypothetical protein